MEFKEQRGAAPQQSISSPAELAEYQLRKRKEFEDALRRQRHSMGVWVRYAQWEAGQGEWVRARSVFERALDVDYRNVSMWLKYVDMEVRHRFISHARNLLDRAITLHPRVDALWYRYVYMEERLGDVKAVRAIFTRWMTFHPDEKAWFAFISFELRHGQLQQVRVIYQQFTLAHHQASSYIRYARFEERHGEVSLARGVFDLCLKELRESQRPIPEKVEEEERLLLAYASFEERQREYERARAIYRYALDHVKAATVTSLFERYSQFEKAHGDREQLELIILSKRRLYYEQQLRDNPHAYDAYFDYLHLEQSMPSVNSSAVRALFERAIAATPMVASKRQWKRYIYLFIHFAVWEELDMRDSERAKAVYEKALALLHPLSFSFAKLWLLYAELCVRRKDLAGARKVFGAAIGHGVVKDSVFLSYLQMEMALGEVDRCRRIFERWLEERSSAVDVWLKFAELEEQLEEVERARRILELAIAQPSLDRPERAWKGYIDMELRSIQQAKQAGQEDDVKEGRQRVRRLYERLLQHSRHAKVWLSYAHFEAGEKEWQRARDIFVKADALYQQRCAEVDDVQQQQQQQRGGGGEVAWQRVSEREAVREERALLLSSWKEYEALYGSREEQERVQARMPLRLSRKRERRDHKGELLGGWEEFIDYQFPDEAQPQQRNQGLRILDMAKKWKAEQDRKKRLLSNASAEEASSSSGSSALTATTHPLPPPPPADPLPTNFTIPSTASASLSTGGSHVLSSSPSPAPPPRL